MLDDNQAAGTGLYILQRQHRLTQTALIRISLVTNGV